mgnify:FL=1
MARRPLRNPRLTFPEIGHSKRLRLFLGFNQQDEQGLGGTILDAGMLHFPSVFFGPSWLASNDSKNLLIVAKVGVAVVATVRGWL